MIKEFSIEQARYYVELTQQYEAWSDASDRVRVLAGSMSWRQVKGRQYLVRSIGRGNRQTSLGPRSSETEAIFEKFWDDKQAAIMRLRSTEERLGELARFNKALLLARVPAEVASVLTVLSRKGILGKNVHVIGTSALYAYEFMAAAFLDPGLLATSDLDILFDSRRPQRLSLCVDGVTPVRLLDIIREVDDSYLTVERRPYSVRNKRGFLIDLIKCPPRNPLRRSVPTILEGDWQAVEIVDIKWLLNAPKVGVIAVGSDGYPVPLSVPDPRAFAIYKLWLSRDPNRDPAKRMRDAEQAFALAELIHRRLPTYPFDPRSLQMFPEHVRQGIEVTLNPFWSSST
ncbi:MAG: nucleotidyltransferase domain-containing protein [Magnetospirillum sp.]|nr:nucleotidyltransferase domain-containing protein [Magnetospirillum sp.]